MEMPKTVDLFLFMGQSNMAGRGIVTAEHSDGAPALTQGAGYEYRAISSPGRLYPVCEPFGRFENRKDGIDDGNMKTGSMVTAFVNAYYEKTGIPVVGVSASKGGSRIDCWQPDGAYLNDAIARMKDASAFLQANHIFIRHTFMLWCQGESDGDVRKSGSRYRKEFDCMLDAMRNAGVEACFLIRIGHYNGTGTQDYREIMEAQDEIARTRPDVVMVSRSFAKMKARGLMKDEFHYFQEAYNIVGQEAGEQAARAVSYYF